MAYNYFPASYQAAYNPYQQTFQQPVQNPQQPQTIQSNGLVSVRNRAEAESYPVAPGNSVTFKDETAPFIYVKTMGFSQLDRPTFEMFRLVKEDSPVMPQNAADGAKDLNEELSHYVTKDEFEAILAEIDTIKATIEAMKQKKPTKKEKDDE